MRSSCEIDARGCALCPNREARRQLRKLPARRRSQAAKSARCEAQCWFATLTAAQSDLPRLRQLTRNAEALRGLCSLGGDACERAGTGSAKSARPQRSMNHFYADLPRAQLSLGAATARTSCNFGHQANSRLLSALSANNGKRDGANLACPLFAAAVLPAAQGRSSPRPRTVAGDGAPLPAMPCSVVMWCVMALRGVIKCHCGVLGPLP